MKNLKIGLLIILFIGCGLSLKAHPMPNSLLNLTFQPHAIELKIQIPLSDFELAVKDSFSNPATIARMGTYFYDHVRIEDDQQHTIHFTLKNYELQTGNDPFTGSYQELVVYLEAALPQEMANNRTFKLYYDAILHQVVTHKALVSISHDWENGIIEAQQELGVIEWDVPSNTIPPLSIKLEKGSLWKGFKSMVTLGMRHIAEGTDHLLFIIVLLLPAPLLLNNKNWGTYGGWRYSLSKLIKIITAFTIGHSITLLLGTLGWIPFRSQWIEITIAISILISAIHAYKPLFFNKEIYVASGFGLIHGLAFSTTLSVLNLEKLPLLLSIAGFNIGIELMQLGIMAIVLPFLLWLSPTPFYRPLRIGGALIASILALAWVIERWTGSPNFITQFLDI